MKAILYISILIYLPFACDNSIEKRREYYDGGQIKSESTLKNGLLNGVSTEFYPDGTRKAIAEYCDDVLHGKVYKYYTSGTLASELLYYKGRMIDKNLFYDKHGRLREVREYDSLNHLIDRIIYNENGEIDFSKVTPIVFLNKDTVTLDEKIEIYARLANADPRDYRNGTMKITSKPGEGKISEDVIAKVESSNLLGFRYEFKPERLGADTVYGQLVFKIPNDTASVEVIHSFKYLYFVK